MATIPCTLIGLTIMIVWTFFGFIALGYHDAAAKWLDEPGNHVRVGIWIGAPVVAGAAWMTPVESKIHELAPELTGIAITVIVIDELVRYQSGVRYKRDVIRQMGSRVNEVALEAVRIASLPEYQWLYDGSLKNVNLYRANLKNADLRGANLEGAHLFKTILIGAQLGGTSQIPLRYVNLKNGDFQEANLKGANLFNADLSGAHFQKTILRDAELFGANLEDTQWPEAELQGTDLRTDKFNGARHFDEAKYNKETKWPDGFDYERSGAIYTDE